ncbi:MAG TPA: alpha/beta hydrolase [Dysgonomonas sp.]|uniref:alpha/beta hydrolase n=1 Tax=unclassified Dysgonomonas TaxID=2630389 RepID=UPI0025BBC41B|nr:MULTISPECIES: alpha/beta hydrolase [unclassified Dysgonomonas]HML66083.1 alpha/beta hydrolase [Dysgonomonas sp.]
MNKIFIKSATIVVCLFLMFSSYSCSGDLDESSSDNKVLNKKTAEIVNNSAVEMLNVAYGEDLQQVMDIYLQENRTLETPLVILIHGGAWVAGDKADANFMKDACYGNGMNVINLNYRLANSSINYTHIMQDISAAMVMIINHAAEYNLRTSKIVFWGGSAGGHLALLYAYNYDIQNAVSLVLTLGAPTKLDDKQSILGANPAEMIGLLATITGKPYDLFWPLDPAYTDASPYYGTNLKPTILIHGEKDLTVPVRQANLMRDKLVQANVDNVLFILPNGGHAGENTTPEASQQANLLMYQAILHYSN